MRGVCSVREVCRVRGVCCVGDEGSDVGARAGDFKV